jgi:transcriptional regulator with XRE-family HTH domain
MDILAKIQQLTNERGWSINYLATKAGLPQSTLSGLFARNNYPTIPTLEKICEAFDITLSEFFSEDGMLTELTEEQRKLLDQWALLSDKHKEAVMALMEEL